MWAAAAMADLGLRGTGTDVQPLAGSRVERDLIGGDPVQRALAAHALARPEAVGDPTRRMRALLDALEDDYPAVRWFGHRGLVALAPASLQPTLARYDFMADVAERIVVVDALREALGPSVVGSDAALWQRLLDQRDDAAIAIGE